MDPVVIRKAVLSDLETLLSFEQGVINTELPFDCTLKTVETNYYDIKHMIDAGDVELLVAEQDNELLGCGYARIENAKTYLQHRSHAYLGFMYVKPEHRGKGINRRIIDALAQWAAIRNITELRLDVYEQNVSAIKAYEKYGFKKLMIHMRKGV
ncbi:MAG TPA: GNAT family N-acetyltransferase [Ferruginibacter sp.]|nr:GNAT family N-acetyltransferase [Ferruginibacter sp.]